MKTVAADSRFKILDAVKNAYLFAGANWRILGKLAAVPLLVHFATVMFIQTQEDGMSELEGFLWALPANILFAWLMFVEARMIVMDERPDRLPRDLPFVMERQRCMRAAVIILLLFNMTITGIMAMMRALTEIPNIDKNMAASIGVMFLLGFMLWGIRLAVAHILAAVGYPIRAFLAKVHGMMFSLRLLGMGFLAALPFLFLIQLIINMLFPKTTDFSEDQITLMVAVLAPISILFPLVLNAAAVFALKDLLGKSR